MNWAWILASLKTDKDVTFEKISGGWNGISIGWIVSPRALRHLPCHQLNNRRHHLNKINQFAIVDQTEWEIKMKSRELEKDRLTFSIVNMLCQSQSAHPLEGTVTGAGLR